MYKFDVILPRTLLPTPSWFNNATHGDELMYVFFAEDSAIFNVLPGHEDQQIEDWERNVAKYVMTLWTNFPKTGWVYFATFILPNEWALVYNITFCFEIS